MGNIELLQNFINNIYGDKSGPLESNFGACLTKNLIYKQTQLFCS